MLGAERAVITTNDDINFKYDGGKLVVNIKAIINL